jgi:IclR family acetate operon transcriptional repressor
MSAGDAGAERAAALLGAVLERFPRPARELADVAGIPPGALDQLVEPLARHGLVAWDADHRAVRPGSAALRFARSGAGRDDLVELARPFLLRLADESGETSNLILPRPGGTEAIAQVDGRHLLGATNWVGRALGLHCTAAGKVFLAFGAASLPDGGSLQALTPATVVDRSLLHAELETVRSLGYATLVDELEPGLSAVGAPVRERGGGVIASVTVAGASLRLPPARLGLLGRVTVEQADELSARLGY